MRFPQLSLAVACAVLYAFIDTELNRFGFSEGWTILWPLNGVTIAILLMIPRRLWPGLLLGIGVGTGIGECLDQNPVTSEILLRVFSVVEIVLSAWLLPPFKDLDQWLRKPRIFHRFAAALAVGPGISGLLAALYFHLAQGQSYLLAFDQWAFADAVGIAGFFPLALAIGSSEMRTLFRPRALPRTLAVLICAFAVIALALGTSRYPLLFLVYPTLLLVDLFLSFSGSAIAAAGLCFLSIFLTTHAHGSFGMWPASLPVPRDVAVQIFLGFHLLALFPASILLRERRSLVDDLHNSNAQLLMLASLDGLTGIPNRRSFDEQFDQEWKRAVRLKLPLALIMIDVDHFKQFNDRYGHQTGDDCLRTVAQTLSTSRRRAQDGVARFGGEEFVLLLPHTDAAGAEYLAGIVRQAVFALGIAHAGSPWGVVTVSIGCSSVVPYFEIDPRKLLHLADAALYRAKAAGRNRVEVNADVALTRPSTTVRRQNTGGGE